MEFASAIKRMMRSGTVLGTVFILGGSAQAAPRIEWEVVNRFPLFADAAQFRALADVFESLPEDRRKVDPVFNLERELQQRAQAKSLGPAFGNVDALARFGWTSAVVRKTCYNSGARNYSGCRTTAVQNYLTMSKTDVSARLVDAPATGVCKWSINGVEAASAPCADSVTLPGAPLKGAFAITVASDDDLVAETSTAEIATRTIVGLGDSFASGEGNPDRPADFGAARDHYSFSSVARRVIDRPGPIPGFLHKSDYQQYPLRRGASKTSFGSKQAEPVWFNGQCHRSLYSHQLKAALQLAIENRHAVIKYFAYACTGAEIDEGILGYWSARSDSEHPDSSPQLVKLLRDHCPDGRKYVFNPTVPTRFDWTKIPDCPAAGAAIDAVLLSVGGNDVGFAKVIAHEFFWPQNGQPGIPRARFKLWKASAEPIPFEEAHRRLDGLDRRFLDLKTALSKKAGLDRQNKVIQLAYPQIAKTAADAACAAGRQGMDAHQIFGINDPRTGAEAVRFVTALNGKIRDETDWTLIESHIAKFDGHAICVEGMADGSSEPDGMRFPDFVKTTWRPFQPEHWRPYKPRNRWFVTPNDAFLAGNYMTLKKPSGGKVREILQPLIAANYGGAFHPNPLGHATMADAAMPSLRDKLRLPGPESAPEQ